MLTPFIRSVLNYEEYVIFDIVKKLWKSINDIFFTIYTRPIKNHRNLKFMAESF